MDHARAGKVDRTMTKVPVLSHLGQPAAAPNPVRVDAVGKRYPKGVNTKVFPRPTLGHGASRNRGRGIEEHHLEEEQREHADVFNAGKEEALRAEDSKLKHAGCTWVGADTPTCVENRQARAQRRIPAWRYRAVPPIAPSEGKAIRVERKATEGIHHHVHRHHVR